MLSLLMDKFPCLSATMITPSQSKLFQIPFAKDKCNSLQNKSQEEISTQIQ